METTKQNKDMWRQRDVWVLPATGGLGTNRATKFALKKGIPGNTATTGPAP